MGDRALIQLTNKTGQVSPVLYLHWSGGDVADIIERTQEQMRDRVNDSMMLSIRLRGSFKKPRETMMKPPGSGAGIKPNRSPRVTAMATPVAF